MAASAFPSTLAEAFQRLYGSDPTPHAALAADGRLCAANAAAEPALAAQAPALEAAARTWALGGAPGDPGRAFPGFGDLGTLHLSRHGGAEGTWLLARWGFEPGALPGGEDPHLRREKALDRVRAIAQAKSRMAGYLAHEVNNPLAGLRNAALLIRRAQGDAEKLARYLDLMDQGITRIQGVVQALAELNREMRPEDSVGALEVAREVESLISRALTARHLTLEVAVDPEARLSAPEAEVVRQVLFNLLMNAIEASPPEGRLQLGGDLEGDLLVLTLRDTGPGVPEELRETIWNLGFSTKRSTITGGLTPGLALSRSLLRDLGGDLVLHSPEAGWGATFSIRLPLAPMQPE